MEELLEDQFEVRYKIFEYFNNLEEATRFARKNGFSQEIINKLELVHDNLVEIDPLLKTDEDYYQLQEIVEKLITHDLFNSCKNGDKDASKSFVDKIYDGLKDLNFKLGFEKTKSLINNNPFSMIGTADSEGRVNIAFAGSATVIDNKRLTIAQMLLHNTIKNLKQNRNAIIIGFKISEKNPMETEIARIYCTLEEELSEGSLFEQIKERAVEEAGGGAKIGEMISKVFLFKINDIRVSAIKKEE